MNFNTFTRFGWNIFGQKQNYLFLQQAYKIIVLLIFPSVCPSTDPSKDTYEFILGDVCVENVICLVLYMYILNLSEKKSLIINI